MLESLQKQAHGAALDEDGEDDEDVGGTDDPAFSIMGRDGERQGDGKAAAESTPGEHGEGTGAVGAQEAEKEQDESD